jgi:anti-sigma-K factor RskA
MSEPFDHDPRFDHQPRSDDAAAYALGALEEHEAIEFRAHVDGCELCAAELEFFAAAGALLPLAPTPLVTPKSLKRNVMKAAAFDAKAATAAERKQRARSWMLMPRLALAGSVSLAAAGALAVVLVTAGGESTTVTRATVAAADVWHATTVPVARLERDGDHGQLVVTNLPETASGKVYEVWIQRRDVPMATDVLFEPNSHGDASVDVPGSLRGAQAVLVTAERSGGATVPSRPVLISATLSA